MPSEKASMDSNVCSDDTRLFYQAYNTVTEAIFVHHPDTLKIEFANEVACKVFGYTQKEIMGMNIEALSSGRAPFNQEVAVSWLEKARIEGPESFPWECRHAEGWLFDTHISLRLAMVGDEKRFVVLVRDMSAFRTIEERLLNVEKAYRLLFEQMSEGVALNEMIYDDAGEPENYRIVGMNAKFVEQMAAAAHQGASTKATELYKTSQAPFLKEFAAVAETGEPFRFESYLAPIDKHFMISVASSGRGKFATIFFDITTIRKAEENLARTQGYLRAVIESSPVGIVILRNADRKVLLINDFALDLFGHKRGDFADQPWIYPDTVGWRGFRPDGTPFKGSALDPSADKHGFQELNGLELRIVRSDGVERWALFNSALVDTPDDVETAIIVVVDVTAHHELEDERVKILNYSVDLICIAGTDGYLKMVNPAWTKALGWSPKELLAIPYIQFVHPEDWKRTNEAKGVLRDGQKMTQFENRYRCRDGSWRWLSWCSYPEKDLVYAVARDVTEEKETQHKLAEFNHRLEDMVRERTAELNQSLVLLKKSMEQLASSEKLVQLGQLVAGVAHEVNSPVGVAVTAASYITTRISEFKTAPHSIDEIKNLFGSIQEAAEMVLANLQRASETINSFKSLSVDQVGDVRRAFMLQEVFDQVRIALHPQTKKSGLRLELECDPAIQLFGFPGALSQIFTNLVVNSLTHAFDERDSGLMRLTATLTGEEIVVEFSDDGAGIQPEVLPHIFEPFFTTRRGAGGSGLGLSIVVNLVKIKLGGTIQCESVVGRGTRFIIRFPASGPEQAISA